MTTGTLLVLGASLYQLPVIARAQSLGYRVVTTDNVPSNPGHAIADVSYAIDTTDAAAVLTIAKNEKIAGVIAPCTDVAVTTAAHVASSLGLRGPSVRAARILSDKERFRAWQREMNLSTTEVCAVTSRACEPPFAVQDGEWLVKPTRSSGSKGIFVVRSQEELARRLPETLAFGPEALVERRVAGVDLTCEGMLRDGELVASWVTKRETAPPPYVATRGHLLPSGLGEAVERTVAMEVARTLHLLDVRDGPFDADVIWKAEDGECFIVEATPRLGGNSLSALVEAASGFRLIDESIACACGADFASTPPGPARPTAIVLLGTEESGVLTWNDEEASALKKEPWVLSLQLDKSQGERVEPFIHGRNRVGEALIVAETHGLLVERYAALRSRLSIRAN